MKLWLARLAFVCLVAGTFQAHYWTMFTADRETRAGWLRELPYRRMPGLRDFMLAVRARTANGDRIAVVLPHDDWYAYSYGFFRATYLLAGRRTIPLVAAGGPRPDNLRHADYVASLRRHANIPGFAPVFTHRDGVLLRRVR